MYILQNKVDGSDWSFITAVKEKSTNGRSGTLEALTTTTTIDLPVAEIQTINRPNH